MVICTRNSGRRLTCCQSKLVETLDRWVEDLLTGSHTAISPIQGAYTRDEEHHTGEQR